HLELVLRRNRWDHGERRDEREHANELALHHSLPSLRFLLPLVGVLRDVRDFADAARRRALDPTADLFAARSGNPPALLSRSVQYSQVRLVTLGSALSALANLVSPAVNVATSPRSLALS